MAMGEGGYGDPDSNWTYSVRVVDETEEEFTRSRRVGEFDVECGIPYAENETHSSWPYSDAASDECHNPGANR